MSDPQKPTHTLSKEDREYLVYETWPSVWKGRSCTDFQPADGREELLDSFVVVDSEHELGMDSHGVIVHLCVYRETKDGPMFAFRWGRSSEETFFDYYTSDEPVAVDQHSKVVTVYSYTRKDGERIDW